MVRTEFDVTSETQQYIAALNVTMDDTVLMQMLQAQCYLPTHCCYLAICHQVFCDNIRKRATLHIFHHHPGLIPVEERADILDDICMTVTRSPHCKDLIYDKVGFWLLIQVHLLDRN